MRAARPLALTTLALGTIAVALGLVPSPAPAGAGGGGGSICAGFARGADLEMHDSCFAGTAHLVAPGTAELTVANEGAAPHTITAVDGSFDLLLGPGETGTVSLPDAAVVPVYCTLHGTIDGSGMAGAVVVDSAPAVAATGSAATPAAVRASSTVGTGADDGSAVVWAVVVAAAVAGIGALGAVSLSTSRRRAAA